MQPDLATLPPLVDWHNGRRRLDWHLLLFGINMVLVPLGYYLNIRFGLLGPVKILRLGLMAFSVLLLALAWRPARVQLHAGRHWVLGLFVAANLAVMPFSVLPSVSLERFLTVLPFWVYTDLIAAYLYGRYGPRDGLRRVGMLLLGVYMVPVAIFFVSGNPFGKLSIYGDESRGFVSNHFGWSSAVALVCLLDLRRRLGPGFFKTAAWALAALCCLWLLLISGSRSSYLSVAISMLVLLAGRNIGWFTRLSVVAAVVAATVYLIGAGESALNQRIQKTSRQIETVEPRILSAQQAFYALNTHEERYLTGVGFDLYGEAIWLITGSFPSKAHNSYLEMFVNCGGFVAAIFLFCLVLPALARYLRFDARQVCMIPPLLIIPYFENNLGAGQFLFYPWMFTFFWYLHDTRWGSPKAITRPARPLAFAQ